MRTVNIVYLVTTRFLSRYIRPLLGTRTYCVYYAAKFARSNSSRMGPERESGRNQVYCVCKETAFDGPNSVMARTLR